MRPSPPACAFASVLLTTCALAPAQVPNDETIARELASIYSTKPPALALTHRGEIAQRVEKILRRQSRFLAQQIKPWDADAGAAFITDGHSHEAGIRPNAHAAFGMAVIHACLDDPAARRDALKLLRFLLPTHGAGGAGCLNGKQWRSQWQSALWATSAGQAAWILWDALTPRERWLAARMICDEADRFADARPPSQVERDTKAEENAWNSQVLALAFNMFPAHPRRDRYREAAIRWQLSSFATSQDLASEQVIEGRPLKDWLAGANLHDDYTLENHDRVHPDYMSSTRTLITQKLFYDWAGNAPPASLGFNVKPIYANLKKLTLPDGGFVYPNAQDWHLHRNADWFDTHAAMAILHGDAQAARLMRICLETAEKMLARSADGGIYADGETHFASSQAMLLELFADAYLLMLAHGEGPPPVDEEALWRQLSGEHRFDAGHFLISRTPRSVATFSWGRKVMGMVLPLQKDLLLTPNERGLIGTIADRPRETPVVRQWGLIESVGQFMSVHGELSRAEGELAQKFAFIALDDGRTVYADIVRPSGAGAGAGAGAAGNAPPSFLGGTLGILNDRNWVYHDAERTLYHDAGATPFDANAPSPPDDARLRSPWYNLDDALGIICLHSTGAQVYASRPTAARGRLEQLFHLNASATVPAASVLIFYPAQPASRTRDAAAACKLIASGEPERFDVILDDGKRLKVDLKAFNVEIR